MSEAVPPPPHTLHDEHEPLLGHPGDNLQSGDGYAHLAHNLFSGTAPIAQAGVFALVFVVWAAVFRHPLIPFSPHPLLNVAGVAVLIQAALILQPTHTPEQKRRGAIAHSILNGVAASLLYAAFIVILLNKNRHQANHFESVHGKLGLTTYIALFVNACVGVAQFYFPALLGGEEKAKSIWKYHRVAGYSIVLLILATLIAATYTDYVEHVLYIRTFVVVVAGLLILAGTLPRVRPHKLGFKKAEPKPDDRVD